MRRMASEQNGYRVEFAPAAWTVIGKLHASQFRRVQEELDAIAQQLVCEPGDAEVSGRSNRCVPVEDLLVVYRVDSNERVVRFIEVAQRLPREKW